MILPFFANSLLVANYLKDYLAFRSAALKPSEVQFQYLQNLIRKNENTLFAQKHQFKKIKTIREYQEKVPLSTYEDYLPYIDEIKAGKNDILTQTNVHRFVPSSGTTTASKLIPYTEDLKKDFGKGIGPWLVNMYFNFPALLKGKSYWSITPPESKISIESKIPIGFEDDSEYFGVLENWVLATIMAVPNSVRHIQDMETFRIMSLVYLLIAKDLTLISVWNPTYLLMLLNDLEKHWFKILEIILRGNDTIIPHVKRALQLERIGPRDYQEIWPNLTLISCWQDSNSNFYAKQLQNLFPKVELQGKGLLATEGFISFPLVGYKGCVLSILSHFFEFMEVNTSKIFLANELQKGKSYKVILTTCGGLYRYQLLDIIEVVGFYQALPLLRFVGKEQGISDFFGEKLHEEHVLKCIEVAFEKYQINPKFFLLAPENIETEPHYTLFIETNESVHWLNFGQTLDHLLRENFHYDYCRKLNQLHRLRIFLIKNNAGEAYLTYCQKKGQKLGNIKPRILHNESHWQNYFTGNYVV